MSFGNRYGFVSDEEKLAAALLERKLPELEDHEQDQLHVLLIGAIYSCFEGDTAARNRAVLSHLLISRGLVTAAAKVFNITERDVRQIERDGMEQLRQPARTQAIRDLYAKNQVS